MDHFGYYTQPLRSHVDPLWFRRMDFMPWLEYMKEQKRLHIIKDPSVSGDLNKRLQCTEEKIKAQMKNMKVKIKIEEGESSTTSAPKRKLRGRRSLRERSARISRLPPRSLHQNQMLILQIQLSNLKSLLFLLPKQKRGTPPLLGRVPGTSANYHLQQVLVVLILTQRALKLMVSKQVC